MLVVLMAIAGCLVGGVDELVANNSEEGEAAPVVNQQVGTTKPNPSAANLIVLT
jgi:hypothetical protein